MAKHVNLTELVSIRTLEKIQDNFSIATGIGCVVRDYKGDRITKVSNPSALWMAIRDNKKVLKEYHDILLNAFDKCRRTGQIEIVKRYMDCYAFTVPMYIEGRIEGFFVGGLTRYGNPDINHCVEEAAKHSIDIDSFLEMYWALPLVTAEKLEACANLLKTVASTISNIAREGSEAKEMNLLLEREIVESEERYRKLFDTINDGVYMTDNDGYIKQMNRAGSKILGYSQKELIGRQIRDVYVHPEDRNEFLNTVTKDGHIEHFHPYIQTKDGQKKYLETSATVIKDADGNITGVQGIFRDINHRSHCSLIKKRESTHDTSKTTLKNTQNNKKASPKT